MDTKWLEDFVSLARTGSFSASAAERHVTQSAFSRRIQSLETWLGAPLVDRSRYPTTLTAAGRQFRETADHMLRQLHDGRNALHSGGSPDRRMIAVAALHTLALSFFPRWLSGIEAEVEGLHTRLLPDDFHNCIAALVEGDYDFLLCFHHDDVPILLDPALFPHVVVGRDSLVAVQAPTLAMADERPARLLGYSPNSFLGRLTASARARAMLPPTVVAHVTENAMAEALKHMALAGHGLAWLPRSLVEREVAEGLLSPVSDPIPLEVRLYRKAEHRREVVQAVWTAAHAVMQNRTSPA